MSDENRKMPELPKAQIKERPAANVLALEEKTATLFNRLALSVVGIMIVSVLVWGAITEVPEITTSEGHIDPVNSIISVQSRTGGTVKKLYVSEGMSVKKNDLLIQFSTKETNLDQLYAREAALGLEVERLRAFISNGLATFTVSDEDYEGMIYEQEQLLAEQRAALGQQLAVIKDQIQQQQSSLKGKEKELPIAQKKLKLMSDELQARTQMFEKGYSTRVQVLQAKTNVNDATAAVERLVSDIEVLTQSIGELENKVKEVEAVAINRAREEQIRKKQELFEVQKALDSAQFDTKYQTLKAPVDGIVKGLEISGVDSVVQPGGTVMDIVPTEGGVLVKSKIKPQDIGHIEIGQDVRIKVSAYDYARYGSLSGVVKRISAATFTDEENEPYFECIIHLMSDKFEKTNQVVLLMPGMTVQAEILTGSKTVIAYLLKPIFTNLSTALSER